MLSTDFTTWLLFRYLPDDIFRNMHMSYFPTRTEALIQAWRQNADFSNSTKNIFLYIFSLRNILHNWGWMTYMIRRLNPSTKSAYIFILLIIKYFNGHILGLVNVSMSNIYVILSKEKILTDSQYGLKFILFQCQFNTHTQKLNINKMNCVYINIYLLLLYNIKMTLTSNDKWYCFVETK